MLVNTVHGQSHALSEERTGGQRYETMQCFALTQPRAMMEEGEGNVIVDINFNLCTCLHRLVGGYFSIANNNSNNT